MNGWHTDVTNLPQNSWCEKVVQRVGSGMLR